jgi:hypothetical protein
MEKWNIGIMEGKNKRLFQNSIIPLFQTEDCLLEAVLQIVNLFDIIDLCLN